MAEIVVGIGLGQVPRPRRGRGRPCAACMHRRVGELDQALAAAVPLRRLAARFGGVSAAGLCRHRRLHMGADRAADGLDIDRGGARWWWRPFLGVLCSTGSVTVAARVAGVSRTIAYRDRDRFDRFALGWEDALAQWHDHLEAILWRRAIGEEVTTTSVKNEFDRDGRLVATVRTTVTRTVRSDKALMALAERHCPEFRASA
jgi:hypothetical protein